MSIVIHNKTGNIYILKDLWAINATNGEKGYFAIYKRLFKKQIYVRRTREFYLKFTPLKYWDFNNKRPKKKYLDFQ